MTHLDILAKGGKVVIEFDIGDNNYVQVSLSPDDARKLADLISKAADMTEEK